MGSKSIIKYIVLCLVTLMLSTTPPLTFHKIPIRPLSEQGDRYIYIISLDVCKASGSAVSAEAKMSVIHECPCKPILPRLIGFYDNPSCLFNPFLIVSEIEHPPRV